MELLLSILVITAIAIVFKMAVTAAVKFVFKIIEKTFLFAWFLITLPFILLRKVVMRR